MKQLLDRLCGPDLRLAWEGRRLWLKFVKRVQFGERDVAVLLPSKNRSWNDTALLYLDDFAASVKAERVFLLTHDERVLSRFRQFSERATETIDFSREQALQLMKFYCLYMFTEQLIIASLDEPEGRDGLRIAGKKGITVDEVFAIGVYRLKRFEKRDMPPLSRDEP